MVIRILFFSALQDVVGCEEVDFEVPDGVRDVAQLLDALYDRWPSLREWNRKIRVAADLEYVGIGHPLQEGQEIAIMPPVQGG
jgi:molybdopterin converting factor subunit 1|tara:strand:+ start:143 stop:391 length:249 start_codon:yes stop_codon:yes gene_type:complete